MMIIEALKNIMQILIIIKSISILKIPTYKDAPFEHISISIKSLKVKVRKFHGNTPRILFPMGYMVHVV